MVLLCFSALYRTLSILGTFFCAIKSEKDVSKKGAEYRALLDSRLNQVPHAVSLGVQVVLVIRMRWYGNGHMLHHIEPVT